MPYLVHMYIEVEDETDQTDLEEILDDHDYPFAYGSTEGLPDTVEDMKSAMRKFEEEIAKAPEEGE